MMNGWLKVKQLPVSLLVRWVLPLLMLVLIAFCRHFPAWAEGYARTVYPVVSAVLSAFSSGFPFSLEEGLAVLVIGWMVIYPFRKRKKGASWKSVIGKEVEVLVWLYIWFYMAWGMNYFRHSVYARLQVQPARYDERKFLDFLHTYTDSLNVAYLPQEEVNAEVLEAEVRAFYRSLPAGSGLARPKEFQRPKFFLFTPLYSGVGVLGSMGPFFAEAQLNADLLPVQLPFTYAHEFSHLLGVSNEAEANYWAYRACIESASPQIRYSGYFGLLPYVLINAKSLLPKEVYEEWVKTIRPEIIAQYQDKHVYWKERYSPWVGKVQDALYNLFLKGNNIPSGKKNYAEVISILLSVE